MLRATFLIAAKDLRLRVRDRSSFIIGIAVPLGLALVLNLVSGGVMGKDFSAKFAVVNADGGEAGQGFAEGLRHADKRFTVTTNLTVEQARHRVDKGDLDAAFVIPKGFTASLSGTRPQSLEVVTNADADIAEAVADAAARSFTSTSQATRLSVAAALAGDPGADPAQLSEAAQREAAPVRLVQQPASDQQLDTTSYLAAGLGVMFSFFLVQFGVRGLLEEREAGTMARLLVAPIPRLAIPAAKALTSVVLGVVALTSLEVGSTVLMGADWGNPLAAEAMIVAVVLAAVSIMGVVAGVAKSAEAAGNAQAVVALALGLLGGSFFPISRGESLLTKLSALTPHHWFLQGLGASSGGEYGAMVGPIVVLLLFALVIGVIGILVLRRRIAG